jgi:hypothetical protein
VDLGRESSGEEKSLTRDGDAVGETVKDLDELATESLVKETVGLV